MLAQFQSLYPTGSLTTELLQIHHGKYIVRSSVQVEGVTRATGMAASEILEEAEDRSRTRALMVLGITAPQSPAQVQPKQVTTSPASNLEVLENRSLTTAKAEVQPATHGTNSSEVAQAPISNSPPTASQVPQTSAQATQTPVPETPPSTPEVAESSVSQTVDTSPPPELFPESDDSDIYSQEFDKPLPIQTYGESEFDASDSSDDSENPEIASDNQPEEEPTPSKTSSSKSTARRTTNKKKTTSTTKRKKKTEPIDLSDVIAKTDVEMERLSWTPQQGREYLIQTYGKRGRTLLTEEELLDFLQHLESIPTPQPELSEADPLAGF
ncbi:MAG: hypothetical protein KI793_19165 [Rivularia sp. (in: Bacteria)]|nr:hypothetical protein [Rivularia sp. MS3]